MTVRRVLAGAAVAVLAALAAPGAAQAEVAPPSASITVATIVIHAPVPQSPGVLLPDGTWPDPITH